MLEREKNVFCLLNSLTLQNALLQFYVRYRLPAGTDSKALKTKWLQTDFISLATDTYIYQLHFLAEYLAHGYSDMQVKSEGPSVPPEPHLPSESTNCQETESSTIFPLYYTYAVAPDMP